jgi:hypothetical protein
MVGMVRGEWRYTDKPIRTKYKRHIGEEWQELNNQYRAGEMDYDEQRTFLQEKLDKVQFAIGETAKSLTGTRNWRGQLLKEYKIATALPALNQLKTKYPQLYQTQIQIATLEKDLAMLETAKKKYEIRYEELTNSKKRAAGASQSRGIGQAYVSKGDPTAPHYDKREQAIERRYLGLDK